MKKIFLILMMILFIGVLSFGQIVQQTTDTAQITLTGFVPTYISISLSTSDLSDLNLTTDINQLLVTATVVANVGYGLSIDSLKAFAFKGDNNLQSLNYSLSDGVSPIVGGSLAEGVSRTGALEIEYPIFIEYTANSFDVLSVDTYTDVLSFTVTAN